MMQIFQISSQAPVAWKLRHAMSLPVLLVLFVTGLPTGGSLQGQSDPESLLRGLADTVGFAPLDWQMDSVMARIREHHGDDLNSAEQPAGTVWKTAICPHDDYCYAGWMYPAVLKYIKAKTVIIFGVAHKASTFNLENQLVFDAFDSWQGPYGPVKVSSLREEMIGLLPGDLALVNDSMQSVEHSVEALVPFLQYQDRDVEIISILVPYMEFEMMRTISQHLSRALAAIMKEKNLHWGKDIALLITSDAVHYGDEDWGGNNYAPYGTDSAGNTKALAYEQEIIRTCFEGELTVDKISRFFTYTVNPENFKAYRWTWCGRYSIPFGLLTSHYLQSLQSGKPLTGIQVAYATSISQPHLEVDDLRMGRTAIASPQHWVGYPAIGFK